MPASLRSCIKIKNKIAHHSFASYNLNYIFNIFYSFICFLPGMGLKTQIRICILFPVQLDQLELQVCCLSLVWQMNSDLGVERIQVFLQNIRNYLYVMKLNSVPLSNALENLYFLKSMFYFLSSNLIPTILQSIRI